MVSPGSAIVIGGGVIGLCSAYYLAADGWKVTVVDKGNLSDNCSSGNAGMIVPSHFVPLAAPGMVAKGIRWMFNSRSPFYVKPSLSPALLSWGWRFLRSANQAHADRSAPFLRDLHVLSKSLYQDLARQPGFDFGLADRGILGLYKSKKTGEEERHLAAEARALGLDFEMLDRKQAQALEPGVELDVEGAVHYRCDAHLYPNAWISQLIERLNGSGVSFRTHCAVNGLTTGNGNVRSLTTTCGTLEADLFVMTGGAWLPGLAGMAGLHIPVMPGKGYSFMTDVRETPVRHPSLLLEARVALTPMNGMLRIGGTMEIAPVNARIHTKRLEGIVRSVPDYYPSIKPGVPAIQDTWYGFRPCSPDGLPYLGRSRKLDNLLVAGGHGMMGLSLGPVSGKLMADLASNRKPSCGLEPFHPERFN